MLFGFLSVLIPLFLIIVLSVVFSSIENDTTAIEYDFMNFQGKERTAVLTDIETQYNVTINRADATIISYKYSENRKDIESQYNVIEERKIKNRKYLGNGSAKRKLNNHRPKTK